MGFLITILEDCLTNKGVWCVWAVHWMKITIDIWVRTGRSFDFSMVVCILRPWKDGMHFQMSFVKSLSNCSIVTRLWVKDGVGVFKSLINGSLVKWYNPAFVEEMKLIHVLQVNSPYLYELHASGKPSWPLWHVWNKQDSRTKALYWVPGPVLPIIRMTTLSP